MSEYVQQQMTAYPIRADVSITHHPANVSDDIVTALEPAPPNARAALRLFAEAQGEMYRRLALRADATKAAWAAAPVSRRPDNRGNIRGETVVHNGVLTQFHGGEAEIQTVDRANFARTIENLDHRTAAIRAVGAGLEGQVTAAITDQSLTVPVAQEIRAHLKSLNPVAARTFLSQEIGRGDRRTITAVLTAPSYLSGFEDNVLSELREEAARMFAPEAHAQLGAILKLLDRLAQSRDLFEAEYRKFLAPLPEVPKVKLKRAIRELAN